MTDLGVRGIRIGALSIAFLVVAVLVSIFRPERVVGKTEDGTVVIQRSHEFFQSGHDDSTIVVSSFTYPQEGRVPQRFGV